MREISSKIRSTNDLESMMRTTISELQLALGANQAQIWLQPEMLAEGTEKDQDLYDKKIQPGIEPKDGS